MWSIWSTNSFRMTVKCLVREVHLWQPHAHVISYTMQSVGSKKFLMCSVSGHWIVGYAKVAQKKSFIRTVAFKRNFSFNCSKSLCSIIPMHMMNRSLKHQAKVQQKSTKQK